MGRSGGPFSGVTELDLLTGFSLWPLAPSKSRLIGQVRSSLFFWTVVLGMRSGAEAPRCGAFSPQLCSSYAVWQTELAFHPTGV